MYAARNVRLFMQRNARERLRHLLFRRRVEVGQSRVEKKRERERACNYVPAGSGGKGKEPEIDMYSMPRRVQSIAGQAGGILSAV